MSKILMALLLTLSCTATKDAQALEPLRDLRESLAKEFEGTYRFNYLFAENAVVYLDESSHFQALVFDHTESAPRITFYNQTSKGEKRAHYSYAFYQEGNKVTLREFDGNGNFRFDCVGTYQPEKRLLECDAPRAPKPARDTDSPTTQKEWPFQKAHLVAGLRISHTTQHFSLLRMGVYQRPGKSKGRYQRENSCPRERRHHCHQTQAPGVAAGSRKLMLQIPSLLS